MFHLSFEEACRFWASIRPGWAICPFRLSFGIYSAVERILDWCCSRGWALGILPHMKAFSSACH